MRGLNVAKVTWLTATLIVAGCSEKTGSDNDPVIQAGASAVAGAAGAMAAGTTGGTMVTAGTTGGTMVVAGTTGGTAGTGTTGGAGGAGTTGGVGGAGTGGTDGGIVDDGGTGGIDTTGFLEDCKQGGAQWGTDEQLGPCASGISTYGVRTEFGPYGVRSEINVGAGFENQINPSDTAAGCSGFIDSFGADPVGSADLKDTHDLDLALYSVFYPGDMPEGETFPLITWGNGTCSMPEGYGPLLRAVASHGYIVVAANSRYVGNGVPMTHALDFMFAENERADSKYYQKIDTTKVGAMGHSQGGSGTVAAAMDARIKSVILWNGGTTAVKPFLAVSGDHDLGVAMASQMATPVNASSMPAAYIWYHQIPESVDGSATHGILNFSGHLTLMMESDRVIDPTVAWWDMMLKEKDEAKAMFVGDSCTLCDPNAFPSMWYTGAAQASIEYGHNTMLQ